jgi:hypothetical protein
MRVQSVAPTVGIPQYGVGKILLVWAAAAVPMAILGWVVTPALATDPNNPGFQKLAILTVGLVWQFILVMLLLYQETGDLRWSTIRHRLWLNPPRDSTNRRIPSSPVVVAAAGRSSDRALRTADQQDRRQAVGVDLSIPR